MRKTKINLILSREDYQKFEGIFFLVRIFVIILVIAFLITFIVFSIILNNSNKEYDKYTKQKLFYLNALKEKQGDEAKIFYMQKKYADLETFMKDDAFSAPYYNLLTSALKESSESSSLKLFNITKDRKVNFTIAFNNFTQLVNFFRFIESEVFLKNFENISLKTFSVIGGQDKRENYELSFSGTFIKLKEPNE